jgi:hypothetical protein
MSSDRYHKKARETVAAFKALLSDEALARITGAELTDLTLMIQKAIADEVHDAADRMAEVLDQLRHESTWTLMEL